jgi:cytochrome c oxidase accessory protein FixG
VRRELVVAGMVFRPTDGAVLMLFGLTLVIAVFLITALFGRAWCGWGCPQTVYLEWVYRPIERLIEGGPERQRALDGRRGIAPRRALTYAVFAILSIFVGNVFLAYFVGVDQLATWVRRSPVEHPAGFAVMAGVSALMFLDFAWFREQTCILACPYGRLQTVLLDRQSTIVGYDATRGEPRGKAGKRAAALRVVGDCVDCKACVATCPTGIDIRNGLQMECVSCAQCIDACDAIMDRLGRKRGLIRYSSQDELAGKPRRILRTRTLIYPALLALFGGLLAWQLRAHPAADVWALRVEGAPFAVLADGRVSSQAPLRVENRAGATRRYTVELVDAPDLELATPRAPVEIAAGGSIVVAVVVLAPREAYAAGERKVRIRIRDDAGFVKELGHTLLGPTAEAP